MVTEVKKSEKSEKKLKPLESINVHLERPKIKKSTKSKRNLDKSNKDVVFDFKNVELDESNKINNEFSSSTNNYLILDQEKVEIDKIIYEDHRHSINMPEVEYLKDKERTYMKKSIAKSQECEGHKDIILKDNYDFFKKFIKNKDHAIQVKELMGVDSHFGRGGAAGFGSV